MSATRQWLVCLKQVAAASGGAGETLCLNPADEAALEAALRLRETAGAEIRVVVASMGRESAEVVLRDALARGADEAVLLTDADFAGADTYATARTLCAFSRLRGPFELIFCGRRAIDGETGQVAPELAAMLAYPCLTNLVSVSMEGGRLVAGRLLAAGEALLECAFPAVVSLCEYAYPLRAPGIMGLRRAKRAEILRLGRDALALDKSECGLAGSLTRVRRAERQMPGRRRVCWAKDADEGARHLAMRIQSAKGTE